MRWHLQRRRGPVDALRPGARVFAYSRRMTQSSSATPAKAPRKPRRLTFKPVGGARPADAIQSQVRALMASHRLKTGDRLDRRGDEPFPTASTIKLAVMCTAFEKQQKGELGYFDTRPITKDDLRGGAGFLQFYMPD